MKYLFSILLLSFIPVVTSTEYVVLTPNWEVGDTQKIQLKEGFIKYEGDSVVQKEVTVTDIVIKVLEKNDTAYVMEWNHIEEDIERVNVEVDATDDFMEKRIEEMFAGNFKLRYWTNTSGKYQSLLNLDELISAMNDSMDVLVKEMVAFDEELGEMNEEEMAVFSEMMKQMIASDAFKNEMDRDIWNYHAYLGDTLVADTLVYYEDELPNQLGGQSIPVKGTITIETDTVNHLLKVNDLKEINEEKTREVIQETLEMMGEDVPNLEEMKREMKQLSMKVTDIENYTYHYQTGFLQYYERNRITLAEGTRKENFIILEEVKEEGSNE